MNSWDLFDTLVARRCVWPFTDKPDFQMDREWHELFPIAENVTRVRPGDLVVSDMYLPHDFLKRVLTEKCGLDNELVLSEDGKQTGQVWEQLGREGRLPLIHTGDNGLLDCSIPIFKGVKRTEQVSQAAPTEVEGRMLADPRTAALGRAMREGRLRTWNPDPELRRLQLCQSQANFPMLCLAAVELDSFARGLGRDTLLISGRDGCLWHLLFGPLGLLPAAYFHSSRVARKRSSEAYLKYVCQAARHSMSYVVLADLCGTGWSLRLLADALPEVAQTWLFSRYCGNSEENSLLADYESLAKPKCALGGHMVEVPSEELEEANSDSTRMVVDVEEPGSGELRTVKGPAGTVDWEAHLKIAIGRDAFAKCADATSPAIADGLRQLPRAERVAMATDFCKLLGAWHSDLNFNREAKRGEEAWIMRELQKGSGR